MDKVILLAVAILMGGCASLNDGSYMPSLAREAEQNPYLLDCPKGGVPICRASIGRFHKSYSMCRCLP
jgi:hypothetical protein